MAIDKRRALEFAITVLRNPYIPHKPTQKQAVFLSRPEREAFYGGAAGGGKSDALLDAALQYVEYPDYRALLLRKTFSDLALPEALMDRSHDWLDDTDAHWNAGLKTWEFPSGATVTFGYLQTEADKFRYRSAEFQFVGFDELTQFSESQYLYLSSRLRKLEGSDIPLRLRSASNPGDIGHEWVKERFVSPSGEVMQARDRYFVPATMYDNPHLNIPEYQKSLSILDPVTQRQLELGDWDISLEGEMFNRRMFPIAAGVPVGKSVRYWDLAATEALDKQKAQGPDWTVGLLLTRLGPARYCIADIIRIRKSPAEIEQIMKQTAAMDGKNVTIAYEEEGGSAGKFVTKHLRALFKGYRFFPIRNTGSKIERARPVSAAAARGEIEIVAAPWTPTFFHEAEHFPSSKVHDDQMDSLSGAYYVHQLFPFGDTKPIAFASNNSGFSPQWPVERPF